MKVENIIADLKQIVQLIENGSEPMAIILIYDLLDRLQEAQKPV
jgi:hypothetical protein